MVPFAGWSMPVQYKAGVLKEHRQCREHAAIFDVSHMLQSRMFGKDRVKFIESLTVGKSVKETLNMWFVSHWVFRVLEYMVL